MPERGPLEKQITARIFSESNGRVKASFNALSLEALRSCQHRLTFRRDSESSIQAPQIEGFATMLSWLRTTSTSTGLPRTCT
jgi:hypothetical protein